MSFTPSPVSSEEQEQILQTIEMFEVIIQASPQDCQSMEILKDAYLRVGRTSDALAIARRLADTYVEQGQLSQAMFEYEAILHWDPTNAEVIAALSDLEERVNSETLKSPVANSPTDAGVSLQPSPQMLDGSTLELEFEGVISEGGSLMAIQGTRGFNEVAPPKLVTPEEVGMVREGDEALGRFLVQNRLVPEEVVSSALERVLKKTSERRSNALGTSLIDEICRRGSFDLETLLSGIIDRSKFAYIPLEYYDVDRSVVRMLPDHLTIGRLIVPFDVVSRTIMIATANPFDAAAKQTAQQLLDYNIQWHLAAPQAIMQVLTSVYKLDSDTISFRLSV